MIKHSTIFLIIIVSLILPNLLWAEFGQRFVVDGYHLHIGVITMTKKLRVSGDVKGGESCNGLKISVQVMDENGNTKWFETYIKKYRRSASFVEKKRNYGGKNWEITEVVVNRL